MSVRKTLARNTMFNAAGRLWDAASSLVLIAYVLEKIGVTAWGLWAVVSVFTGYVALLDFGVGSGFAKYIAEHAARDERDDLATVVSSGFFFYLILGIVIVAIGWPCIDAVVELMIRLGPEHLRDFGDPQFAGDVRFLLRWGLVLFATSNCVTAFTAVQTGLQRMGVTNVLSFVGSLVKIGATVAFLEAGYGVRGLLYANALVLGVFGVSSIAIAFKLEPGLRVSPTLITRDAMSRLFGFGWRAQVAKLANLIMFKTDTIIVAFVYRFLGMVGLYELGLNMANKMRQIPLLLLSALLPAASDLDARSQHERLRELYLRSTKYVAAVALPLALFTVGAAGPIMRAWMGEKRDLAMAAWVLRIIAFGYIANILPGAGISIALGKGRADIQMKAGLIATAANVLLTVLLVAWVGFYGIPVATALSMFLSCAWFFIAMRSILTVDPGELLKKSALWPTLASFPGLAICIVADWLTRGTLERGPNAVAVVVCAIMFGTTYAVLLRVMPFIDSFDAGFLEDTLGLKHIPGVRLITGRAHRV